MAHGVSGFRSQCVSLACAAATLLSVLPTVLSSSAFAWGNLGHRLIGKVGTELTEEGDLFWGANEQAIMSFANTPDVLWKSGPGASREKPTHWFHFDVYSPDGAPLPTLFQSYASVVRKYSESSVVENGTGLWRVQQFFVSARDAFQRGDEQTGLQWAGAMAHYVGDLSQPLHVTHNYDGQLTGQAGLHSWFETAILEKAGAADLERRVEDAARALLADPAYRAQATGDLMRQVLLSAQRTATTVDTVLSNDKRYGRSGDGVREQLELAVDRLADGSASYALLLSRLWKEGGRPDAPHALKPRAPAWAEPNYSRTLSAPTPSERAGVNASSEDVLAADCQ